MTMYEFTKVMAPLLLLLLGPLAGVALIVFWNK